MQKAFKKHDTKAETNLGLVYAQGWGVSVDINKAAELFRMAADAGNPVAQLSPALLYERGQGVPKDAQSAV